VPSHDGVDQLLLAGTEGGHTQPPFRLAQVIGGPSEGSIHPWGSVSCKSLAICTILCGDKITALSTNEVRLGVAPSTLSDVNARSLMYEFKGAEGGPLCTRLPYLRSL
jgi:hypothetical protein